MKKVLLKLMLTGLLMMALAVFCPQGSPGFHYGFAPTGAQASEAVLPPPGVKHLKQVEDLVFEMTNQARRARGLAPLIKDAELRHVARAYSINMLVRRFFDHITPEGLPFDQRISRQYSHWIRVVGENIWSGVGYNHCNAHELARDIMRDWMSSPGHRANVLDPDYTHLGVGISVRHLTIDATQEFVGRFRTFQVGELRND